MRTDLIQQSVAACSADCRVGTARIATTNGKAETPAVLVGDFLAILVNREEWSVTATASGLAVRRFADWIDAFTFALAVHDLDPSSLARGPATADEKRAYSAAVVLRVGVDLWRRGMPNS